MSRLVRTSELVDRDTVAPPPPGGSTLLEVATWSDLPTDENGKINPLTGLPGAPADGQIGRLLDQDWPIFWKYFATVTGVADTVDIWLPGLTDQGIAWIDDTSGRPWRASRRAGSQYLKDVCTQHVLYDTEAGGPFVAGEVVTFGGGGTGTVTGLIDSGTFGTIAYATLTAPDPETGDTITGGTSGATALVKGAPFITGADRGWLRNIFGTGPQPIVHDGTMNYDGASGAFTVGELVTFGGGGTARIVRDVDTSPPPGEGQVSLYIQSLPLPVDNDTIVGALSGVTADVMGTPALDSFVLDTISNAAGSRLASLQFGVIDPTDFGPGGPTGGGYQFVLVCDPKVIVSPPFVDFASAILTNDTVHSVFWSNSQGGAVTTAGAGRARYVPVTGGPTGQQRINRLADFDRLFLFGTYRPQGSPSPPGGQEDGQICFGYKAIEGMIFGSSSGYETFRFAVALGLNRAMLYCSTSSTGGTARWECAEFMGFKLIPKP